MNRRDLFQGLAALTFTPKNGLWVPPAGLAVGGVSEIRNRITEKSDLLFKFSLVRTDGTPVFKEISINPLCYYHWVAWNPGTEIIMADGGRMRGFTVGCDIVR